MYLFVSATQHNHFEIHLRCMYHGSFRLLLSCGPLWIGHNSLVRSPAGGLLGFSSVSIPKEAAVSIHVLSFAWT